MIRRLLCRVLDAFSSYGQAIDCPGKRMDPQWTAPATPHLEGGLDQSASTNEGHER